MRNDFLLMPTTVLDPATPSTLPCGEHAARALCQRVGALRAALESLRACIPVEDGLHAPVACAVAELEELARDVRALVDWSLPATVRPLECTLEEIGLAAVDGLAPARRATTLVAVERPATRIVVDGPLASRCLARIVEHGLTHGARRADLRIEPRDAAFRATASFEGDSMAEDSLAAALAEPLARRDLARLGARLEIDADSSHATVTFGAVEAAAEGPR